MYRFCNQLFTYGFHLDLNFFLIIFHIHSIYLLVLQFLEENINYDLHHVSWLSKYLKFNNTILHLIARSIVTHLLTWANLISTCLPERKMSKSGLKICCGSRTVLHCIKHLLVMHSFEFIIWNISYFGQAMISEKKYRSKSKTELWKSLAKFSEGIDLA